MMTYEKALAYLTKAKAIGAENGAEVSVAVLDAAGHPVLLARGKAEAWHGPYMAAGKARLAAAFRKPTAQLLDQWADRPLFPQSLVDAIPAAWCSTRAAIRSSRMVGASARWASAAARRISTTGWRAKPSKPSAPTNVDK